MKPLEPPDSHYYNAAIGWLDLGNPREAQAEFSRLSPEVRSRPDALELRWIICERLKDWTEALAASRELIQAAPERASGWLHQAYSLRRAPGGGLNAAWDALMTVAHLFPEEAIIAYNLACYAAQLNKPDEAWDWLLKAKNLLGRETLLNMARNDPDLRPLEARFEEL